MQSEYLGLVDFQTALNRQEELVANCSRTGDGRLLGFETHPTITLGRRSAAEDLLHSEEHLNTLGFKIYHVDRGGQATIHNPGQLVIFPIIPIPKKGVRRWIDELVVATRQTLSDFNFPVTWNEACPGLYSEKGKVASIGIRVRDGVSTHGIAINVINNVADFQSIRACGVRAAAVDHLGASSPEEVFRHWVRNFSLASSNG